MSKKVSFDLKTLVLCAVIVVGLVLAIIGFFGNFAKADGLLGGTTYYTLSDLKDANDAAKNFNTVLEGFAATNVFAWVTFILAIVVTVLFALVKVLGIKGLDMVVALVGCLTVVAAILVFVFALVMVGKNDGMKIAVAPILMLIGGLLAGGAAAASGKI